jgi:hypothetical protein
MHHPKLCGQGSETTAKQPERFERDNINNRRYSLTIPRKQNLSFKSESFYDNNNNKEFDDYYENLQQATSSKSKKKKIHKKMHAPTLSSSSNNSNDFMDPLKWDELLRILQEDYTKLVL